MQTDAASWIVGPTPESRAQLRADFAASSHDWADRAIRAFKAGNTERAAEYAAVARVAGRVADGVER